MAEKRKFARLDIALTVGYAVIGQGGAVSAYSEAISSDISAGGLRLMTPTALERGSELDLEIYLGDEEGQRVHARGEVVWQSQISKTSFETGIVIRHMESEDQKKFMGFVFDQMSKFVGISRA